MATFIITANGADFGTFTAANETAALDMLARDISGYDTMSDYMIALDLDGDDFLVTKA